MDETDQKIIKMLQKDGRMNYNAIASRLRLANATIHARVIKLKRKGIITGFTAVIEPKAIGKPIPVMLSISVNHEKDTVSQTVARILELPDVVFVYCTTGEWDYHIIMHVSDIDSMKSIITYELKKKVPHVIHSSTQIIMELRQKPIELY